MGTQDNVYLNYLWHLGYAYMHYCDSSSTAGTIADIWGIETRDLVQLWDEQGPL